MVANLNESLEGVSFMGDTLTLGTIAGTLGTGAMHILSVLFLKLNLIRITTLQVSSAIFIDWSQVNTPLGIIIGIIVHIIIGAAGGVLLAYFIRFSGKDFYYIKGLALAGFMLLVGMGLIIPVIGIVPQLKQEVATVFFHILYYLVYGLVTSYIIARYGIFPTKN